MIVRDDRGMQICQACGQAKPVTDPNSARYQVDCTLCPYQTTDVGIEDGTQLAAAHYLTEHSDVPRDEPAARLVRVLPMPQERLR